MFRRYRVVPTMVEEPHQSTNVLGKKKVHKYSSTPLNPFEIEIFATTRLRGAALPIHLANSVSEQQYKHVRVVSSCGHVVHLVA